MRRFARRTAAQIISAFVAVTGFVTEMGNVDQRGRIIGQNAYRGPRGQSLNALAQPQNRQRAQQSEGINFQCLAHVRSID